MANRLTVKVEGTKQLLDGLAKLNPQLNTLIIQGALKEMVLLAMRTSARKHLIRSSKGAVQPKRLTSRHGTLRRSLGLSTNIDKRGFRSPNEPFIEGGTHLNYGRVHELGFKGRRRGGQVRAHTRKGGISVKRHGRRGAKVNFPERPFLAPGLAEASSKFEAIFVKHWRAEGNL